MIGKSRFECICSEADVCLVRFVVVGGDCCLVYNRFGEALAKQRTTVAFSAVAFVGFLLVGLLKDSFVMSVDGLFDVAHAGVANFDCVSVEDFMKTVVLMKFFVKNLEECLADVGGNVLAIRRVVPCHVPLSFPHLASRHTW